MSSASCKPRRWTLALVPLTLSLLAFPLAGSAEAETSLYLTEQPGLSLEFKAEGGSLYVTYLHAVVLCYGAGGHWYEGAKPANHWSFRAKPTKLRRRDGHLRLVRRRSGPFDSEREVLNVEVLADRIVGSFSYFASGEGIGGSCESDAPGFTPEFGQHEPPVSFEAPRYVPLGSPLAAPPDPAAQELYFQGSGQLEILLGVQGSTLTQLRGSAREACENRRGRHRVRRRLLELEPPVALEAGGSALQARASRDWPYLVASSLLTGSVSTEEIAGDYRAAIAYREGRRKPFDARCRTGSRGSDGHLPFRATRYLPVQSGSSPR